MAEPTIYTVGGTVQANQVKAENYKVSEIESLKRQISFRKLFFVVAFAITVGCAGVGIYQFGVLKNSSSRLYVELYYSTFIGSLISCISYYELVCLKSDFKKLEQEKAQKKELEDIMEEWWENTHNRSLKINK